MNDLASDVDADGFITFEEKKYYTYDWFFFSFMNFDVASKIIICDSK